MSGKIFSTSNKRKIVGVIDMKKIEQLCEEQPRCTDCMRFYYQGSFSGCMVNSCLIHGVLEDDNNPHHDMDGSKCKDYVRKTN